MSFCAGCGRPRNETARFCGSCGTEFTDSAAPDDQETSAQDDGRSGPPEGVTRTDVVPEAGRAEPPAEPDPFASWYQPEARAAAQQADAQQADAHWQPTQTVQATPTQAAAYQGNDFTPGNPFSSAYPVAQPSQPGPPGPPGPPFAPGSPAAPPRRGGSGGKSLLIIVAVIVVLAAGGGAYALAAKLGKHTTAQ
jgi:hypothetical protein